MIQRLVSLFLLSMSMSMSTRMTISASRMFPSFTSTHVVREFTLVISRGTLPDKTRPQVLVNQSVPGPTLYATLGDRLRVIVINELDDDATAIHWHGMSLSEEPWEDGVIGVSQCPISNVAGVNRYVYEFTPQSTGTFWYHGHYHSQYPDGLYGSLIVTSEAEHDLHSQFGSRYVIDNADFVYQLADYYLQEVRNITDWMHSPLPITIAGRDPIADSFTVNNRFSDFDNIRFNPLSQLTTTSTITTTNNKTLTFDPTVQPIRWRFLNTGAFAPYRISIDGAVLELIEIDGVAIEPLFVWNITVYVSQRISVIPHFMDRNATSSILRIVLLASYYPQYIESAPNNNLLGHVSRLPLHYEWTEHLTWAMTHDTALSSSSVSNENIDQLMRAIVHPWTGNIFEAIPLIYSQSDLAVPPEPTHVALMKTMFRYFGTNVAGDVGIVKTYINDGIFDMTMGVASMETDMPMMNNYDPVTPVTPPLMEYINTSHALENAVSADDSVIVNQIDAWSKEYFLPYNASVGHVQLINGSGAMPYQLPASAVVDLIIDGKCCGSHPFHLHGHHFYLIDSSAYHLDAHTDDYSYYYYADNNDNETSFGFTRVTKPIRDVAVIPAGGWIRIRFVADNPGIWMMHCHLHWHMEMGLVALFVEDPEGIFNKYHSLLANGGLRRQADLCNAPVAVNRMELTTAPSRKPSAAPSLKPTTFTVSPRPSSPIPTPLLASRLPTQQSSEPPSMAPDAQQSPVSSTLLPSQSLPSIQPSKSPSAPPRTGTPSQQHVPSHPSHTPATPIPTSPIHPSPIPTSIPSIAPSTGLSVPSESPVSTSNNPGTSIPIVLLDASVYALMNINVDGLRVVDFQQVGVQEALLHALVDILPFLRATIVSTNSRYAADSGSSSIERRISALMLDDSSTEFHSSVIVDAELSPQFYMFLSSTKAIAQSMQQLLDTLVTQGNLTNAFRSQIVNEYYNSSTIVQVLDTIFIVRGNVSAVRILTQMPTRQPTQFVISPTQLLTTGQSTATTTMTTTTTTEEPQPQQSSFDYSFSELYTDHLMISVLVSIAVAVLISCLVGVTVYAVMNKRDLPDNANLEDVNDPRWRSVELPTMAMAHNPSVAHSGPTPMATATELNHGNRIVDNCSVDTSELLEQSAIRVAEGSYFGERARYYLPPPTAAPQALPSAEDFYSWRHASNRNEDQNAEAQQWSLNSIDNSIPQQTCSKGRQ